MAKAKLQVRLTLPPAPADLANAEEHRRTVRDLEAMFKAIEEQPPGAASGYMRGLMLAGWRALQFVGPGPGAAEPGRTARHVPQVARVPAAEAKDKFADDLG